MRVVCPTMHAEHLHLDDVWSATRDTLARSRLRWTIFVDPLQARIEGADLTPVLDWLADHGHEVAMHTHHHRLEGEPGHTTGFVMGQTLSDGDIARCLGENHQYLAERGHTPRGFVSGSWLVLDAIYQWLAGNGFVYDSTLRTYTGAGPHATLVADETCPGVRTVAGLVEVPTTAPIREQVRREVLRRPAAVRVGDVAYDLYYLHDYDLVQWKKRGAVRLLDTLERRAGALTVGQLVDRIGSVVGR